MATDGQKMMTSIIAGEALTQFRAVAFNDRLIANSSLEANGIIENKPASAGHAAIAVAGEIKFCAGGAIAAGTRLMVTTSGYITECTSGIHSVGANGPDAVTSGSIGRGFFNFAAPMYQPTSNNV